MINRSPFPFRSHSFPGNSQHGRSPVPLPIRGNGYGNAHGSTERLSAFPTGTDA